MNDYGKSIREKTAIINLSTTSIIRGRKKLFEYGGVDALESKHKGASIYEKKQKTTPV